jgi:hypothetical protein
LSIKTGFRKSDFVQWVTILTLAGFIWKASARASSWDIAVQDIKEMKPQVEELQLQMAVLVYRAESINKHLASIDRKTQ